MIIIRSKYFSKEDSSDSKKAVGGTIAGTGALGLSKVKTGRLTGKVTRYHDTEKKNVEKILNEGLKAKYAEDPNNLTNQVLKDVDMSKKKGLVYTAKKKSTARSVGQSRQARKNPDPFKLLFKPDHKVLKLEFDYDDLKNSERIANPELRGAKNAKEFFKHVGYGKYEDLDPFSRRQVDKAYDQLNNGTHIFRGDIDPSHIVGGKGYKKRTLKQVAKYIKNNPKRFGKEAAKVVGSAALVGTGAKLLYDSAKKDKD